MCAAPSPSQPVLEALPHGLAAAAAEAPRPGVARGAAGGRLAAFLDTLHLAWRQPCGPVELWPLLRRRAGPEPNAPRCAVLADALEDGFVSLVDWLQDPWVPGVLVANRGIDPVLVLCDEDLPGGDRDLLASATCLVPARDELAVPASSLGASLSHRWHAAWHRAASAVRPLPDQVGFVVTRDGVVDALEAVASPSLFARCYGVLLRAHTAEPCFPEAPEPAPPRAQWPRLEAIERFLAQLAAAPTARVATPGLGERLELRAAGVEGSGLAAPGLVHLSARARGC